MESKLINLEVILSEFIHFLKYEKRYSSHTIEAYHCDILQFFNYISHHYKSTDLSSITHFHVRSWLAEIKDEKNSALTINRKMSTLSSLYKFLQKNGTVNKNPIKQLHSRRTPERLPIYLKEKESNFLLEELQFEDGFKGFTDRLICELLYSTGIRRNELVKLKENDIEWSLRQIRILGKGNKERLVPVSEVLIDALRDYVTEKKTLPMHNDHYFFNLESGEALYAGYVYRVVKHYLSLVTTLKKRSPHVLRHTFATHILNNGGNIQSIKDLLGHSSLAATQIYTHTNIEQLKNIHRQNHPRG